MTPDEVQRPYLKARPPWRHPLIIISAIAILASVIALGISAGNPDNITYTFLTSVLVFLASGLLSYLITHANERQQFADDLMKLSDFAKRRVDLLSDNLISLTEVIENVPTIEETKRLVIYTLNNLEQDARASVQDIEDMGDVFTSRRRVAAQTSRPSSDDIPSLPAPESDEAISYNCTNCGYSNQVSLGRAPGSTRQTSCSNCRTRLNLHRLTSGGYRVVNPAARRTSSYDRVSSYAEFRSQANSPVTISPPDERDAFLCPRCQNRITFNSPTDQRLIEKPCFSCLSVATYDRITGEARILQEKQPKFIDDLDIGQLQCVVCTQTFVPRKYVSHSGKQFICCFNCNTVYLDEKERKTGFSKSCPNCAATLIFKLGPEDSEAKQFCFECMTRLLYSRNDDAIKLIEHLHVPKLDRTGFIEAGKICPHCHEPASDRYTTNSSGQKLSICWNCKQVFEFV